MGAPGGPGAFFVAGGGCFEKWWQILSGIVANKVAKVAKNIEKAANKMSEVENN
ncbi:hypothetical protein [Bacillus salipaludis]|uniref:hypothetical protein n=1 Tax=Bacillus salipaludis TaxID=2547811 RepID=UPI002E1BB3A3|nr:hypothetical protein [Bacillus salipaludis]